MALDSAMYANAAWLPLDNCKWTNPANDINGKLRKPFVSVNEKANVQN